MPFNLALRDLTTPLQIHLDGAEATERILATAADPILYFRFRNDFCQEVRRPTRGLNLAVVPSQWQYDEARSGIPPIEPEIRSTLRATVFISCP